ncbi:MAG: glutamate dehydrogenase, partial [Pirellula sp.]
TAIQGFGNVGSHAAKYLHESAFPIIAVSDVTGAYVNPKGLNIPEMLTYTIKNKGMLAGYTGAERIEPDELLSLDADLLIPAALGDVINAKNVDKIKASLIIEGANGPITSEAEPILLKKGILVMPDMYVNAGGVVVSYFEWLKNLSHVRFGRMDKRFDEGSNSRIITTVEQLTGKSLSAAERSMIARGADEEDLVNSGLEDTMISSYHTIMEHYYGNPKVKDMRTAAFISSIDKIAQSYLSLGIFP